MINQTMTIEPRLVDRQVNQLFAGEKTFKEEMPSFYTNLQSIADKTIRLNNYVFLAFDPNPFVRVALKQDQTDFLHANLFLTINPFPIPTAIPEPIAFVKDFVDKEETKAEIISNQIIYTIHTHSLLSTNLNSMQKHWLSGSNVSQYFFKNILKQDRLVPYGNYYEQYLQKGRIDGVLN